MGVSNRGHIGGSKLHDWRNWHHGSSRCEGCGVRPGITHLLGCPLALTVIDVEEFERAKDDPEWAEFVQKADRYIAEVQGGL